MSRRLFTFALVSLFASPAISAAGPIQFSLGPGNLTTSPRAPALGMALVPLQPPGPNYTFDPAIGQPANVAVVAYEPGRLPTPAARDIHPDGTTHWNNDGYFGVDLTLTDSASGESALLHFSGRAHMYNSYSTGFGWGGTTNFWFMDISQVTLGGNDYSIWGTKLVDAGRRPCRFGGSNSPAPHAPEPGTFLLCAIGLVPLGLRLLENNHCGRVSLFTALG